MLHLDIFGEGSRNVVLLHGCPSPPEHMRGLGQALARTHRVFLVHNPGYGRSPAPSEAYSMAEASEWLESALRERGVKEAALVGHSAGAYRALHLVTRRQLDWTGVVAMGGFARILPEQRAAYLQFAELLPQGVDFSSILVDIILGPAAKTAPPERVEEVASWLQATPAESLARELTALANGEDLVPLLRDVPIPCLALVGEFDPSQPPERSREFAEAMPHAELQVFPGAGHLLLDEDFSATLAAVEGLLERMAQARGDAA